MGELCGPLGGNAMAAHLIGMHSAIKMLNNRIKILHHHLVSIQKGMWLTLCHPICIHPLKCYTTLCHEHVAFWRYTSSVDNWALVLIMKIVCIGEAPYDHSLLRQVSSLIRRLPAIDSSRFQDDFLMVCTHLRWVEHWLLWVNSLRKKRLILLDPLLWLLKS
jgi:COP9 signalosome complex subunit 6